MLGQSLVLAGKASLATCNYRHLNNALTVARPLPIECPGALYRPNSESTPLSGHVWKARITKEVLQ